MKAKEIRELTESELRERLEAEINAYNQKKINHAISPIESSAQLRMMRVNIARMKTILRELENQNK